MEVRCYGGVRGGHDGAVEVRDEVQRQDGAEDEPEARAREAVQERGVGSMASSIRFTGRVVVDCLAGYGRSPAG